VNNEVSLALQIESAASRWLVGVPDSVGGDELAGTSACRGEATRGTGWARAYSDSSAGRETGGETLVRGVQVFAGGSRRPCPTDRLGRMRRQATNSGGDKIVTDIVIWFFRIAWPRGLESTIVMCLSVIRCKTVTRIRASRPDPYIAHGRHGERARSQQRRRYAGPEARGSSTAIRRRASSHFRGRPRARAGQKTRTSPRVVDFLSASAGEKAVDPFVRPARTLLDTARRDAIRQNGRCRPCRGG